MKHLAFVCLLAAALAACTATVEPTGSESQPVISTDWTSMQTSLRSGSNNQHYCLVSNGPNAAGTAVALGSCDPNNSATSFTLVPSNSGVPMGTFTPNVRIEQKNQDGSLSGFCIAPTPAGNSTQLLACSDPTTAIHYEYGAIFTSNFLCLQDVENGAGQLPWGVCTTTASGWEPANLPCFVRAVSSPGTLYANTQILSGGSVVVNSEPPSGTVVDGTSQPTGNEIFCVNWSQTSGNLAANTFLSPAGVCGAVTNVQEQPHTSQQFLIEGRGAPGMFGFGRNNLNGGWNGIMFDNSGNCWDDQSAAGLQVTAETCVTFSAFQAWDMICAGK